MLGIIIPGHEHHSRQDHSRSRERAVVENQLNGKRPGTRPLPPARLEVLSCPAPFYNPRNRDLRSPMANCEHVNKLSVDSGSIFFDCCNSSTSAVTTRSAALARIFRPHRRGVPAWPCTLHRRLLLDVCGLVYVQKPTFRQGHRTVLSRSLGRKQRRMVYARGPCHHPIPVPRTARGALLRTAVTRITHKITVGRQKTRPSRQCVRTAVQYRGSLKRPRTVSRETPSCSVSLTNSPAKRSSVHRARPCGGLEQAVATSSASSLPESLRLAPGRGSSLSAASKFPSTKRRLVR